MSEPTTTRWETAAMSGNTGPTILDRDFDLATIIEHSKSVLASQSLESVYDAFRAHPYEFVAVVEGRRYAGMVSRGHVGFLLGARFGFALYAKQPVTAHLLASALAIPRDSGLMTVLNRTLSRTDDNFYDDVALVDGTGDYIGMIPVRRLIGIQSDIISEQSHRTLVQQTELTEKNKQLFRSLNELRQSQGRYEALLKNSALGIALLDKRGMVEVCNPRTELLIGPILGEGDAHRNLANWIVPGQREAFLNLLQKHEVETSASWAYEGDFTVQTANRGERLFRFFTTWIVETGQVCVQFHDVTEQRALERQVALTEKSALFESLVGGIAHELNNKLTPVMGFAGLLYGEDGIVASGDEASECCRMILESTKEAAKLVRQLLQLSRPAAMEMAPCDLGELAAETGKILSYRLRETKTHFQLDKPARPAFVLADASQIKQVLLNLLINAIDAMEHVPTRDLRVSVRTEAGMVVAAVSDTGHGIKAENLNRIFNPFFTTKAPDRGTGMGLSVCLSIVRQHKGEIAVDSTVGVGTRFQIRLPCATAERAAAAPRADSKASLPAPQAANQRLRIMIVDDEQFITALVQESLRRAMGWQVERAHNGRHAIERLEREEFDMLISDVRMPEVDGLALYQWIREHRPILAARMLFVTGDAGSAELTKALHDLGRPVLHKPFTTQELIEHCQRIAPL